MLSADESELICSKNNIDHPPIEADLVKKYNKGMIQYIYEVNIKFLLFSQSI